MMFYRRALSAAWGVAGVLATVGFLLPACGGGGAVSGAPTPILGPQPTDGLIQTQGLWLARHQLTDGAVVYSATEIEPYFANIAATGWLKNPVYLANVRAWMGWYVAHINKTDVWNLGGTIYDYTYAASGVQTSTNTADSVDSYAATFLTLARQLYDTKDPTSQSYIASLQPTLEQLGTTILALQQPDGLTVATTKYRIAYLEDNCEVRRGLSDLAYLEQAVYSNSANSLQFAAAAAQVSVGIATLWDSSRQAYAWAKAEDPVGALSFPTLSTWYPDAVSQLFPILEGDIPAASARSIALWAAFNQEFPAWDQLTNPDGFPWALVEDTAAMMDDVTRVDAYIQAVQKTYGASGFQWPWYDLESGWYMRADNQLLLGPSLLAAEN